jgi:hypothetical protein
MAEQRDVALADAATHSAARKVLLSMNKHWAGLTVFVEQPCLALDNNAAERAHLVEPVPARLRDQSQPRTGRHQRLPALGHGGRAAGGHARSTHEP